MTVSPRLGDPVAAGTWCASIDQTALGEDPRSDLHLQPCDEADARQLFSYDTRTKVRG